MNLTQEKQLHLLDDITIEVNLLIIKEKRKKKKEIIIIICVSKRMKEIESNMW